jgi:hypothetical protein
VPPMGCHDLGDGTPGHPICAPAIWTGGAVDRWPKALPPLWQYFSRLLKQTGRSGVTSCQATTGTRTAVATTTRADRNPRSWAVASVYPAGWTESVVLAHQRARLSIASLSALLYTRARDASGRGVEPRIRQTRVHLTPSDRCKSSQCSVTSNAARSKYVPVSK